MKPNPRMLPDGRLVDVVKHQRDVHVLRCIPTLENQHGILDLIPGTCFSTCTVRGTQETVVVETKLLKDPTQE